MKIKRLTLILILTALLASAFLPGSVFTVQAAGPDESVNPKLVENAPVDRVSAAASPVLMSVVSLVGILFGILTFLPLFGKEEDGDSVLELDGF